MSDNSRAKLGNVQHYGRTKQAISDELGDYGEDSALRVYGALPGQWEKRRRKKTVTVTEEKR